MQYGQQSFVNRMSGKMTDWRKEQAKLYLIGVRINGLKLKEIEEQIETLSDNIKAVNYSKDNVTGGSSKDGLERSVLALIDSKEQLETMRAQHLQMQADANMLILKLDDWLHREVLRSYYINCERTDEIASRVGYSKRHIDEQRNKALEKFGEYLDEKELGVISAL